VTSNAENLKGENMKKLIVLSLMIGSVAVFASSANASTTVNSVGGSEAGTQYIIQDRRRQNRRWNNRRGARIVTTTRIVGYGRNRYRETVRITYLPNGRTRTQVISRQRLRW
jgi:hypothetical protein